MAFSRAGSIPVACPKVVRPPTNENNAFYRGVTCGSTNIRGPFYIVKGRVGTKTNPARVLLIRSWFCRDCQETGETLIYGQATDANVLRAIGKEALIAAGADKKWFAPKALS